LEIEEEITLQLDSHYKSVRYSREVRREKEKLEEKRRIYYMKTL
jgi:hypothetical protein